MNGNGDMLRLARHLRGFHQVDAANALSIDQSLLSRLENGLVELREEVILKAAKLYRLPKSFFYQYEPVYGAPVSIHPMWRRKADVTAREMDGVVAELNVRIMHLKKLFEGAEVANTSNLPKMDIEEFGNSERVAGLLRAHWRVPSGPIKNLTLLAEKSGIIVSLSTLGHASISGVTFSTPGMPPLIVLNSDQPADRRRFTLAHELGHLVMHRFPTPNMEEEANAFAVSFLMPSADIRAYFIGRKIDLSTLAAMKPEWRVSMAALLMRAHALKFVSENQYRYLWKQLSSRGYRLREPPELDFVAEQPELINQVVDLHLNGLGYSQSELASMLNVYENDVRDLYGLRAAITPGTARLTILK